MDEEKIVSIGLPKIRFVIRYTRVDRIRMKLAYVFFYIAAWIVGTDVIIEVKTADSQMPKNPGVVDYSGERK